ncbi:Uncharacterised protein [Mycobacteroides abscessus subsp. massiliense]|nr:Uncharacterised protein [Mycobacteroides abscessus subsp. massiliense]
MCPEIVPAEHRFAQFQGVQQADQIADGGATVVCGGIARCRRAPVAAHIRCDGPIPGRRECRQLVTPRVPEAGKAMAQHHCRSLALLGDVHVDSIDRQLTMGDLRNSHPGEAS